jgi:GSCFA family
MKAADAVRVAARNRQARDYPGDGDARVRGNTLFPVIHPSFQLAFSTWMKVFTIGSCFARNVEEALFLRGVRLPTRSFAVPDGEWPGLRNNGLLNEFNPGSICQRIVFALQNRDYPPETIVAGAHGFADLSLPGGGSPVTLERALERRRQIADVYRHLASSQLVVITLGFVEAWFDTQTRLYLNQMPTHAAWSSQPDRYQFQRIGVDECVRLLGGALAMLVKAGPKVVLTLSPVPLQTTFSEDDCQTANQYSKSVLRVVAEQLSKTIPGVDYFPSYEIVVSGGLSSYEPDHVHVRDDLVREITRYMVEQYSVHTPAAAG